MFSQSKLKAVDFYRSDLIPTLALHFSAFQSSSANNIELYSVGCDCISFVLFRLSYGDNVSFPVAARAKRVEDIIFLYVSACMSAIVLSIWLQSDVFKSFLQADSAVIGSRMHVYFFFF